MVTALLDEKVSVLSVFKGEDISAGRTGGSRCLTRGDAAAD